MRTVVLLGCDEMGDGDRAVGQRLLGEFLRHAATLKSLSGVLFYNTGVKLVARGSPVLPELSQLTENGVDLLVSRSCLEHYGLRGEAVIGAVADMDAIVCEMNKAERIIRI